MKYFHIACVNIFLLRILTASVPMPHAYVCQGVERTSFLVMQPVWDDSVKNGLVIGYEVNPEGSFDKKWQVHTDYAFSGDVFLGSDDIFVKINDAWLDVDDSDLPKKIILQFYKKGKLLNEIKVGEIVNIGAKEDLRKDVGWKSIKIIEHKLNQPRIDSIPCGNEFLTDEEWLKIGEKFGYGIEVFLMKTVQSELLLFDMRNGKLIYRKLIK